jgi:DNA-binding NarL/FixJ family response regulator
MRHGNIMDHDMNALRVLLLEDEEHWRVLLRGALAELGERVATITEAHCLADFRKCLADDCFDLCLTDLRLPDGSSIDMIRFARAQTHPPTALVVSSLADEDMIVQAILAVASGYVSTSDGLADMARAIAIAADGGSWISPSIAHRILDMLRRQSSPASSNTDAKLTTREHGILKLVAKGHNYPQIAELVGTGLCTVYTHVRHIYEKLQVSNLQQALYEARLRCLI